MRDEQRGQVDAAERADPEDARNGTSGALVRSSIATNAAISASASAQQPERLRRAPAGVVGVDQRVDQQRQAGGDRDRAGDVEVARAARCGSRAAGAGRATAATMPIGTLTNRTHSQPAHSVSTPPSSTPTAPPEPATAPQTPSALLRSAPSAKIVVTIDSAAGESSAAPRPCTARAAISWPLGLREAAGQRGEREQDEAGDEQPAAAEQVGHAAAQQQEAAEGERVGVDDPREVVLGELEVAADRRQRDVDDRRVEHDDELRQREQRQGASALSAMLGDDRCGLNGRGLSRIVKSWCQTSTELEIPASRLN